MMNVVIIHYYKEEIGYDWSMISDITMIAVGM